MLVFGPLFPILLIQAVRRARPAVRRWIWAELLANLGWIGLVFAVLEVRALEYHVVAMAIGQCLTAFFAVWTVHHNCDRTHYIARTLRNRLKNFLTFNMFLHIEHHLFPAVRTRRLPTMSIRIDQCAPELKRKLVF